MTMEGESSTPTWTPLPPRGAFSTRERHRRMRQQATISSASDHNDSPSKGNSPENTKKNQPRKNRPGFNSYLKVLLDENTMDRLYEMAVEIRKRTEDSDDELVTKEGSNEETAAGRARAETASSVENISEGQGSSAQSGQDPSPPEEKKPRKRSLRFKPRSRASLHMTFFFGGETLCELPETELVEWHGQIAERLKLSGFCVDGAMPPHPINRQDFGFKVTELRLFPPKRNNLVVAVLEASPMWHTLHDDIRNIAKTGNSPALKEITQFSKDKWTAHVTMGNIMGGRNKAESRELAGILQDMTKAASKSGGGDFMFQANTSGIAMGGPMPEQVRLDWDFHFRPSDNDETEKTVHATEPKRG